MPTQDFIIELFRKVDDEMLDTPKHHQPCLYPSETVTLGLLFAIKGVGNRAFYRRVERGLPPLFPAVPTVARGSDSWLPRRTSCIRALTSRIQASSCQADCRSVWGGSYGEVWAPVLLRERTRDCGGQPHHSCFANQRICQSGRKPTVV